MDTIFKILEEERKKEWFKAKYKPKIKISGPLDEKIIEEISRLKEEPEWMLRIRLKAFRIFEKLPFPHQLREINLDKLVYYSLAEKRPEALNWENMPKDVKKIYKNLNLPTKTNEISGIQFQLDSHPIFREYIKKLTEEYGVIFSSLDEAVIKHKRLVKKYFGKLADYRMHKFASLNTAVWSGGVFIYVPKNIKLNLPLHAYYRINLEHSGQFERTLIIVDKGSELTYVEGCSSPINLKNNLHATIIEVFAKENSKVNFITIQNWSKSVYNFPTKIALAKKNSYVSWISFEVGSKFTMSYPTVILEKNSVSESYSLNFAGEKQKFDTGRKVFCLGRNSRGIIDLRGIATGTGKITNRIFINIEKGAKNSQFISRCDSIVFGNGKIETLPKIEVREKDSYYNHEGKIESFDEDKIFYLRAKGFSEMEANKLLVFGFSENILNKLPSYFRFRIETLLNLRIHGH